MKKQCPRMIRKQVKKTGKRMTVSPQDLYKIDVLWGRYIGMSMDINSLVELYIQRQGYERQGEGGGRMG